MKPYKFIPYGFVLFLAVLVPALAGADGAGEYDWARFRGPDAGGISVETRVFDELGQLGLRVAWKTKIGSAYSGISVAGGKAVTVFVDGEDDVIAAFDTETGEKLWSHKLDAIYVGHDGSHDGGIATPLIADGRVFAIAPRGRFVALALEDGKELWSTHLTEDHGIAKPHYGFGASPILEDGTLVVQLGGEGTAVGGFDPATGAKRWTAGNDTANYQVPIPVTLNGRRQLLVTGDEKLFGLGADGEILWEGEHGGSGGRGSMSLVPVAAGENRFFLAHKNDSSKLVEVVGENGKTVVKDVWEDRAIRNSFNIAVHKDGYLYAFSSRFLTCVDAKTGESRWRSRQPGDGFLILVDGRLVIVTKNGSLHVAEASPEGYRELVGLPVFDDQVWSFPSFAAGSIYVRSFGEIARVDLVAGAASGAPARIEVASRGVSDSAFGKFLAEVDAAADGDKKAVVDRFMAAQKSFPIIEGNDHVHFVYRGEAEDLAVAGDLFGARQEQAMTRVPGTDLFYHSAELEADARTNYLFIKDYEETVDPRNPRRAQTILLGKDMEMTRGDGDAMPMSWFAMPDWREPAHLAEAPAGARGKLEKHEVESKVLEDTKVAVSVYVPRGYADGDERLPVAYVHGGSAALEHGRYANSLDNLIGKSVEPVIVVFLDLQARGPQYGQVLTSEIVPFVDEHYRTQTTADARANIGTLFVSMNALMTTLGHRELFGKVAVQTPPLFSEGDGPIHTMLAGAESPPRLYVDWARYDMRNPHEAWDLGAASRNFGKFLREKGIEFAGGEANDGTGWSSWRNRTDKIFEALFPIQR